MMTYRQINQYTRTSRLGDKESVDMIRCTRRLRIIPLKTKSEKKLYYDKELKIQFESLESYRFYEIEVEEVLLKVSKNFRKATDFLRRLNYKYDWIQVEISNNGKIAEVNNLEKLRANWLELKASLLKNYSGKVVDDHLNSITKDFKNDKHFEDIFSQYSEYGLLFPPIPQKHNPQWRKSRSVKLDNKPDTGLVETISFAENVNELLLYNIELKNEESSQIIRIDDMRGSLIFCPDTLSVCNANIDITYSFDNIVSNQWNFRLIKLTK